MTTRKFRIFILLINCITLSITGSYAQETLKGLSQEKKSRPFQFTFIYPLGTNGVNSPEYSNDFSLNILGGFNGGVNAFEVGAFANINHGNVNGFQASGFTNINLGKTHGFQAAGFYNQSKEFSGGQFAGFVNLNTANSIGFMGAGFVNVVRGNMYGWQAAGFVNTTTDSTIGAQLAAFVNFSRKGIDGAQIASFANIAEDVDGAQISGFVNVAKNVDGVQLGFINIADSIDGIPIGFLSIVRNGYRRLEVGASESLFGTASYKIGVDRFYNIFTAGFKQIDNNTYWSYGYGIGTLFQFTNRININIDAISQQVNENSWETNKLNLLNTLRLNISYRLANQLELVAGPSYNVMVSEFDFREGIGTKSAFVPYSFYDKTHDNVSVKMFVGFNAALRF